MTISSMLNVSLTSNKPIVLIDQSYYIFNRYYATLSWFNRRYGEVTTDVIENNDFIISFFRHFENDINRVLEKKANIFDVTNMLSNKADAASTNLLIQNKANFSDVGYDLSIIAIAKEFNSKTKLYNTGIKIDIPIGYYVEIVPRSSISKSGYMLANSIGIIDCSYKGELFVALTKVCDDTPEISFPFKCCQLIMKKQIFPDMVETNELEVSKRAEGGFGSSG